MKHNRLAIEIPKSVSREPLFCSLLILLVTPIMVAQTTGTSSNKIALILYDEQNELPGLSTLGQSLRTALTSDPSVKVDVFGASLDVPRFQEQGYYEVLRDYYRTKYSRRKVDVVVAVRGPALDFLLAYGNEIFPGTPIVFCGVERREVESRNLGPNVTGVLIKPEFNGTLEQALRLQPDTRRVVFISGTSSFDKQLAEQAVGELRQFEDRLEFTYLTDLSLKDVLKEVSHLPRQTIVLYTTMFRDGAGEAFVPQDVASLISQQANAPVYGFLDQFLGHGIVGGHLYSLEAHGNQAGEVALRLILGERVADMPNVESTVSVDVYDWRELQRWGISENRLPPGSVVRFKEQSLFELYKWQIIGIIGLCLVEAFLIFALLAQRARRGRAEVSLRLSEERFSKAFRASPDAFAIVRRSDGIILEINDHCETLLGYGKDEASGHTSLDLSVYVNPDDRSEFFRVIKDQGFVHDFEIDLRSKAGAFLRVAVSAEPIEINKDPCLIIIIRDITARQRAEEKVRLLQSIAVAVAAASDLPSALEVVLRRVCEETGWVFGQVWIPSQDGSVLECSTAWRKEVAELLEFRITSQQQTFPPGVGLPGRVWASRQPAWVRDVTMDENFPRAEVAKKSGLKAALAIPILSDGNVIAVIEFFMRDPREEDERLVKAIVAVATQLSLVFKRKKAEDALRREKEFSDTAISSLPGVFYHYDENGRFLSWNENFELVTGYSRDEIADMHPLDFFVGDDKRLIEERIGEVFRTGEGSAEADFICKDGRAIPYYFTGRRVLFDKKPYLIGVGIDIAERKRAEEALRKSEEALRESYNQIRDLAGRLLAAQEEERKHIARELHDDLNQQVAALAIGLGTLERQLPEHDGPVHRLLTKLEDKTTGLSEWIRRLSHQLHSTTLEHVGLEEALRASCSELRDQQGISVSFEVKGSIVPLPPNIALCLYRVAQESLRNIAKHSGATSAELTLAMNGEAVELRIADHGIGFDSRSRHLGEGLGLVSMLERVRLVRGKLEVNSQPGHGTELRVHVPIRSKE